MSRIKAIKSFFDNVVSVIDGSKTVTDAFPSLGNDKQLPRLV